MYPKYIKQNTLKPKGSSLGSKPKIINFSKCLLLLFLNKNYGYFLKSCLKYVQ